MAPPARGVTFGGDLTAATDYIFRGVSQNDGHPAAQFDVHAASNSGFFAGMWGSTLDSREPRADYEVELFAGKRFELSTAWSASATAVEYSYVHREGTRSDDYQELSVAVTYLDALTFSVAASPNAVRWWRGYRLGRYPAYDADVTGQWPLAGNLYATAGAGYYYLAGPAARSGTPGYAYGNAGLALEWKAWRLDAGYFFADSQARWLFPYSASNNRLAATLNWRF
jgi:uncharacterized protein (TIGR02001 family)